MAWTRWAAIAATACACTAWAAWGDRAETYKDVARVAATTASPHPAASLVAASGNPAAAKHFTFADPVFFNPVEPDGANVDMQQIAIADVTGDNRDDVVLTTEHPEVWVIPQKADGTLDTAAPRIYVYGPRNFLSGVTSLMLADINEDGVLDIITNALHEYGEAGGFTLLLSDGHGGHVIQDVPSSVTDYAAWFGGGIVDANLDGHRDIVAYSGDSSSIRRIWYGDGKGNFPRHDSTSLGLRVTDMYPETPDLNGDGVADLVVGFPASFDSSYSPVSFMLNDRKGGYSTPFGLSESYADATFGDFDHNALTDMVLSNGSGLWTVPQFIPGGFGSPIGPWKEYREIMRPHAVDLDRDGATDLVSLQCEPLSFGCSWPFLWVHLQWTGLLVDAPERPYLEISNISQFDRQAFAHGDINSDGCTDVLFVAHTTGLVIKNGRNCSATRPVHNDFDGDRKSDLLWHDAATGMSDLWQGASLDQRRIMANVNPTMWELVDTGDFDNDSKADMLWRNRTTGANIVWRAGNYRVSYPLGTLADTAWHVAGSGDFNGDRKTDLLWRNTSTGANMVWTSSNVVFTAQLAAMPDPSWRVIGIGDFDGDGRDDVFWRNVATGKNAIWKSANANTAIATGAAAVAWQASGLGDFDGDGKADIVWRNKTTGQNVVWRSGNVATPMVLTSITDQRWQIAAVGDYDSDGRADLLWRHATFGVNTIWRATSSDYPRFVSTAGLRWLPVR